MMPTLGVSFREAADPSCPPWRVGNALESYAHSWGYAPSHVALWRRLAWGPPDAALLDRIAALGSRVVVFMESSWQRDDTHERLLRGEFDAALEAYRGLDVIIRFNQEMNGRKFPWTGDPVAYVNDFRYVAEATGAHMFWCPMLHSAANMRTAPAYYPGDAWTTYVGFDRYVRTKHPATRLDRAWAKALVLLDSLAPRKRVLVGEFGIEDPHPADRAAWLATLARVRGVEAALYFDLDLSDVPGERVSWKLDAPMTAVAKRWA